MFNMKNKNFFSKPDAAVCFASLAIFFSFQIALCPIKLSAETPPGEKSALVSEKSADKASNVETGKADSAEADKDAPLKEYTLDDFGPRVQEESYGWTIFKLLFVLGLMSGGFYYFFRFVSKQTGMKILGRDVVNVLSVVPLGQNKHLQVIDLDGRVLVLGVTEANINLITEVTSKSEIDKLRLLSSRSPEESRPAFQDQLVNFVTGVINRIGEKRAKGRGQFKSEEPEYSEDYLLYLKNQKNRLKKMNGSDDEH